MTHTGRPIKFRAWDTSAYQMCQVASLMYRDDGFELYEVCVIDPNTTNRRLRIAGGVKLMQYTDLKDKNGVEIYEGDIITNNGVTNDMKRRSFAIEWATDRARWVANDVRAKMQTGVLKWDTNDCEVIGNIYEHRHLLDQAA